MADDTLVFGRHPVEGLLRRAPERVIEVRLRRGREVRATELIAACEAAEVPVRILDVEIFDKESQGLVANGVLAQVKPLPEQDLESLLPSGEFGRRLLIVLDGVEDPRNLGAVLRAAAAFDALGVVIPRDRAAPLGPAARKTSVGAAELVPVVTVVNLRTAIEKIKKSGFWVYGAAADGTDCREVDLSGDVALVLGAEGRGLRRLTREACDGLVAIPMSPVVESLNVATAAAVLAWEVRRREALPGLRHGY